MIYMERITEFKITVYCDRCSRVTQFRMPDNLQPREHGASVRDWLTRRGWSISDSEAVLCPECSRVGQSREV